MAAVTTHALRRALARAEQGKAVSVAEATELMSARGADLERLASIAAHLRDLGSNDLITYSRKVFIPLTMLCRDHCHYCTFAKPPAKLDAPFLSPEEVLAIARGGRERACKEALFTLGDRPEERYEVARRWLAARGFGSTLEYVRASAIGVIEGTGLLPHLNPGVMTYEELARLRHVSASMGLMLETSSDRLSRRGGPHFGSPDKHPAVRLRTIEDAGRLAIPFTTGILVGIGEDARERAESVFAIRDLHRRYGHIQEVIVQNFRAKPGTAMADAPEPDADAFLAAVATTRIVLGPHVSVQAPPNLSDRAQQLRLLDAGISDWGGVSPLTPDHVNPERPWPAIDALAATTAARGKTLRERLTIYPRFALDPHHSIAGKMRRPVDALARRRRARARRHGSGAGPVAGPGCHVEAADDRSHVREGSRGRSAGGRRRRLRRDRLRGPGHGGLGGPPRGAGAPRRRRSATRSGRPSATARSPMPRRSRCSRPRAPISTRSDRSPTASDGRPSGTSSPT